MRSIGYYVYIVRKGSISNFVLLQHLKVDINNLMWKFMQEPSSS